MLSRFLSSCRLSLVFLLLISTGGVLVARDQEEKGGENEARSIDYTIDLSEANRHYITVTATIPVDGESTVVMMPVWTPGSYLIREYPKHVTEIRAYGRRNRELPIIKTTKNRWTVDTSGRISEFQLVYRVYCRELSVRTNYVDADYAVLNGAATFITRPDMLQNPATVRLVLREGWRRSATSLRPNGSSGKEYRADSFHELVDSPIVAGQIDFYPFEVGGVMHALVNVNDNGFWDGGRAARDLKKMVEAHQKMWGSIPYDRYLFLNVIGSSGGGLEHDNCCLVQSGQLTCTSEGAYRGFLSLCSHEFFHTWNVRRLRPAELAEYDYENENYTPSLWVAEGVTSYYEDLLLVRAGLFDGYQMIGGISGLVSNLQTSPGRSRQSLRDSSHDTWIKFYRREEHSSENEISYYSKGAVVAWLLDAEIRNASGGQKSLDDVMRTLFREKAGNGGYTADEFQATCEQVAGQSLAEFFRRSVNSTDELDYQTAASFFGLDVGPFKPLTEEEMEAARKEQSEAGSDQEEPDRRRRISRGRVATLGVNAPLSDGKMIIKSVTADSAGDKAGLSIGDEIIAIDSYRVSGSVETLLRLYEPDDAVGILIARGGRTMELIAVLEEQASPEFWSVAVSNKDNREREKQRNRWLAGEPFGEAADNTQPAKPELSPPRPELIP